MFNLLGKWRYRIRSVPSTSAAYSPLEQGIRWAGITFPRCDLGAHYALIGASGSGKTTVLRSLMSSALRSGARLIINDRGHEFGLDVLGCGRQPILVNPFDQRCARWDLCRDLKDSATAGSFAASAIPERQGDHQPYFRDAAWELARAGIISLQENFKTWQLRDLIEGTKTETRLRALLNLSEVGRVALECHANEQSGTAWPNVFSTLRTKLVQLEDVALIWEKAEHSFSIEEWMKCKTVLLLGYEHLRAPAIDALNRALFERATQAVLASVGQTALEDDGLLLPDQETWFFAEEAREFKRLEGLRATMNEGRRAGAHVVISCQEIAGLQAVYGKEEADELLANCDQMAILKLNHPATREWAAQWVGQHERWRYSYSNTSGQHGSKTTSRSVVQVQTVLPQQFRDFKKASFAEGVYGIASSASLPPWFMHVTPEEIAALPKANPSEPRFIPRDRKDYSARPWTGPVAERIQEIMGPDSGIKWPTP
jgi:hypothetical protein